MTKKVYNPLLEILEKTFKQSTIKDLDENYVDKIKKVSKWACYSDYCFDDKNKPNDVVTFTLIPYINDFRELSKFIESIAKVDIKSTRIVTQEFTNFLKNYPLINFSFIINDRKKIIGKNNTDIRKFLQDTFELMKQQYIDWGENQPEQKEYYKLIDKKINCILHLIKNNKKIKQIIGMLLVTFFGAYVSSRIMNRLENVEIFGWFSDRDAINEVCDNFSIDLFHNYFHGLIIDQKIKFVASPAGSRDNPFYEELVRIPDYIAGALSDYNMNENKISKDKFNDVLTDYMAENTHNNFVFKIYLEDNNLSGSRVTIHKKDE